MFGLNPDGRNIFLINTPFQFLLANLIKSVFALEAEFYIITDFPPSLKQIDEVAKIMNVNDCYDKLFRHPVSIEKNRFIRFCRGMRQYLNILRLEKSFKASDNVFIGLPTHPLNRPIICNSEDHNLVFFDDGTATIRFLREREKGIRRINFKKDSIIHFYTRFYPRSITLDKIVYFTIYPGLRGGTEDKVVHLRSKLPEYIWKEKDIVDEIWFIGGSLVENRVLDRDDYASVINYLIEFSKKIKNKFVYFPHRTENWIYSFSEDKGIEIFQPSVPWEVFFAQSTIAPRVIVSIISSVIINLAVLGKKLPPMIYLELPGGLKDNSSTISIVQDYARNIVGIPVVRWHQIWDII